MEGALTGRDITLSGPDGNFGAYLASPASGRGPGLVVIQEIFGVNDVVRDLCDQHAAHGRFALAPDLFWRQEPGVQISDRTEPELKKAFGLMSGFNMEKGVADIATALTYLRGLPGCTGKAGAIGHCLGGLLAYLTACQTDSDATVGYYGVNIQNRLKDASGIHNPLMLHIAGHDEYVPPDAQEKIVAALKDQPQVTLYRYPEMGHAFARPGGKHYDQANAELANTRTETFLRQHLG
jgi:carboxymethylenebutenolidase